MYLIKKQLLILNYLLLLFPKTHEHQDLEVKMDVTQPSEDTYKNKQVKKCTDVRKKDRRCLNVENKNSIFA